MFGSYKKYLPKKNLGGTYPGNQEIRHPREVERMNVPMMIENKVANSLHGSILDLLSREYQFIVGDKFQDMFPCDMVELVKQ